MNRLIFFLVLAQCLAGCATNSPESASKGVVVRRLVWPLPLAETERGQFLWATFGNQPDEQKFNSLSAKGWAEKYSVFSDRLVRKAEKGGLDSLSLAKVLQVVLEKSKGAPCVPVGAYTTTLGVEPVWVVVVKWGAASGRLCHVRMYAFQQRDLEQVGYASSQ